MSIRVTSHLSTERVGRLVGGDAPHLSEVVHLLWCALCADVLERDARRGELGEHADIRAELAAATAATLPPSQDGITLEVPHAYASNRQSRGRSGSVLGRARAARG